MFEYRKINNHSFSLKINILFFLPFENNIIKSISYEIIQILTQRAYIGNGEKSCFILQQIHWAGTRDVI